MTIVVLTTGAQVAVVPARGVKTIPNLEYASVLAPIADRRISGNARSHDILKQFFGTDW